MKIEEIELQSKMIKVRINKFSDQNIKIAFIYGKKVLIDAKF